MVYCCICFNWYVEYRERDDKLEHIYNRILNHSAKIKSFNLFLFNVSGNFVVFVVMLDVPR